MITTSAHTLVEHDIGRVQEDTRLHREGHLVHGSGALLQKAQQGQGTHRGRGEDVGPAGQARVPARHTHDRLRRVFHHQTLGGAVPHRTLGV